MSDGPIGVFDSGVGGLTVVKEIVELMPGEDIIYFGDTARAPYGSRPPSEILQFMKEILQFFSTRGVKMAVVACNTMTALGLEKAKKQYGFPMVGVNDGVRSALKASKGGGIGVIATQATIASGKHGNASRALAPDRAMFPQACPKFVPLIENEQIDGEEMKEALHEYLHPMVNGGVDALILGCTHYPLLQDKIRDYMGQELALVNPAYDTAVDVRQMLMKHGRLSWRKHGEVEYCVSGDPERARRLAGIILGDDLPEFKRIQLQDFF